MRSLVSAIAILTQTESNNDTEANIDDDDNIDNEDKKINNKTSSGSRLPNILYFVGSPDG